MLTSRFPFQVFLFSLPQYQAVLEELIILGDTHVVLDIRLTIRAPRQTSRLTNLPLELISHVTDELDLASVVRFAQSCKPARLGALGRQGAIRVASSPLSLEFSPPSRHLPPSCGPSLLGNRVTARVVEFLEPLLANGRARPLWLASFRYAMAVGNVAIINEGVRAIIDSSAPPRHHYFFAVPSPAAHVIYEELENAGLSRMPGSFGLEQHFVAMQLLERSSESSQGPACTAYVIETEPGRSGIIDTVHGIAPTTATMNFMTHENIVCLVPLLTLRKRFAVNTARREMPWFDLGPAVVRLVRSGYVAVGEFPPRVLWGASMDLPVVESSSNPFSHV
jgi:hypothetical protein